MLRKLAFAIGLAAISVPFTPASAPAAESQFGTEKEARQMLDRAVAALNKDEEKAIEMFNKGEGGFRDRDLYVFCANASDGTITAHPSPSLRGEHLQDIVGKKGYPLGKEMMQKATEGKINEVTYWWPRPGEDEPLQKRSFYTKVQDQNCGVGYYAE